MVTVTIHGEKREFAQGTSFETIAADYQKEYDGTIALVTVNGKIRELFKKVTKDCTVDFFTLRDDIGYKTYVQKRHLFINTFSFQVLGKSRLNSLAAFE